MNLEDKKMLITGGTSGIGHALAAAATQAGAKVLICGRNPDRLSEVSTRLGVPGARCDIADGAQLPGLLEAVQQELGGLDVLVQNAGIQRRIELLDEGGVSTESRSLCKEIDINLTGPIRLTALALPYLEAAAAHRSEAALVFVTSILALAPKVSAPIYCASKAGLRSFAKAMRYQLDPVGIRVLEVVPPVVDTAMTAGRDEDKVAPEIVADAILEALRSDRDEIRIGKARLLFRLHRLAPGLAESIVARK